MIEIIEVFTPYCIIQSYYLELDLGLISKAYQAAVETQSTAAVKHLLGKILKEDTVKALQVWQIGNTVEYR